MLSVKVSTKHQIAVPSEVRHRLGIKAGDRLDVDIDGDVVHLRRHVPVATRLRGIGVAPSSGADAVDRVRALRDESERALAETWDRAGTEHAGTSSTGPR
jgi:AbrB family looped-hinge helix DNA binding protein